MRNSERGYASLARRLRRLVEEGSIPTGGYLPTNKQLAAEHGVSPETARRAAKLLESEGLVSAQPRQGFRVLAQSNDPDRGLPIAFVVSSPQTTELWDEFHRLLFAHLQKSAADRGWSVLAVGAGQRSSQEVMDQLRDCRASGLVVDSVNSGLLDGVGKVRLPTVMMDAWEPEMRWDAVVQDSFQGALVATQYLVGQGHRRIAWLGPVSQSVQSRERFGGYCAGMIGAGLNIPSEFMCNTPWSDVASVARALLARPDRPTAVLGLWHGAAVALVGAAVELGLEPGKDVEVFGWVCEEDYDRSYRPIFAGHKTGPAMVWSVEELARLTVARMAERRATPAQNPMLVKLPARLKLSDAGERT